MLVVLHLLRRVDADDGLERLRATVGSFRLDCYLASAGEVGVQQCWHTLQVVDLFTGQAEAGGVFAGFEL